MATEFCPQCHQRLAGEIIAGVRLSNFKAELFHFIELQPGHTAPEIAQHFEKTVVTIRAHLYQMREALMGAPVRIRGGQLTGYHIEKV